MPSEWNRMIHRIIVRLDRDKPRQIHTKNWSMNLPHHCRLAERCWRYTSTFLLAETCKKLCFTTSDSEVATGQVMNDDEPLDTFNMIPVKIKHRSSRLYNMKHDETLWNLWMSFCFVLLSLGPLCIVPKHSNISGLNRFLSHSPSLAAALKHSNMPVMQAAGL